MLYSSFVLVGLKVSRSWGCLSGAADFEAMMLKMMLSRWRPFDVDLLGYVGNWIERRLESTAVR